MNFKGEKIVVFGLAKSGAGAANLLASLGADVTVTDKKSRDELEEFAGKLLPSVRLALGGHPEKIFDGAELVIVSPGVPLDIEPLKKAKKAGIKIIGELELAYQIISDQQSAISNQPKILAVTGTNGKSTTTTLLDLMMKKAGFKTIIGGNIGNALTEEIGKAVSNQQSAVSGKPNAERYKLNADFIVAEVSSFQLESIDIFKPRGAVILNITPDHLDRYHSMEEYKDAKARIFLNQDKNDFLVLNADDPEVMKVESLKLKVKSEMPKTFYFSRKKKVPGIYYKDDFVHFNFNSQLLTLNSQFIRADEIKIKGVHNLENAMAASAMALLAGCPAETVASTLKEFPGLEHRLEFLKEIDGVDYINDSKGTNVGAVEKSLESFSRPVILIAGGRDKAGDFSLLRPHVKNKVKALILIGEAKKKIKEALGDLTETRFASDMEDAVIQSRELASRGDVVLLSPACASFDMFRNFEDRGEKFKKIVRDMDC